MPMATAAAAVPRSSAAPRIADDQPPDDRPRGLDAQRADAALAVGRAEHRQPRGEPVATGRRGAGTDAIDIGEGALQQDRVGHLGAVAVAPTDRLGEPHQLAAAAAGVVDPSAVMPADRST